jgi:hypothetical protein
LLELSWRGVVMMMMEGLSMQYVCVSEGEKEMSLRNEDRKEACFD